MNVGGTSHVSHDLAKIECHDLKYNYMTMTVCKHKIM